MKPWIFALCILPTVCCQAVVTPIIVAQSDYLGQNGNATETFPQYPYAETFIPLYSGKLDSISVAFEVGQSGLPPFYVIQFRDAVGGVPDAFPLATANASTAPLSSGVGFADVTADFSSFNLSLQAGHQYSFSVGPPGPGSVNSQPFFISLTTGYADGQAFILGGAQPLLLSATEDIVFTVRAVPEPSCLAFGLLGLALAARRALAA